MDDIRAYKQGRIHTYPRNLEIADIDTLYRSPGGIVVIPTYYNCEIFLSIYVIQKLLRWAVKNNFVILDGCIIVPLGNRRDISNVGSKEKDDETQTSSSLSASNEDS